MHSLMSRHVMCLEEYAKAYTKACQGMQDKEIIVECSMPQHTIEYAASCNLKKNKEFDLDKSSCNSIFFTRTS